MDRVSANSGLPSAPPIAGHREKNLQQSRSRKSSSLGSSNASPIMARSWAGSRVPASSSPGVTSRRSNGSCTAVPPGRGRKAKRSSSIRAITSTQVPVSASGKASDQGRLEAGCLPRHAKGGSDRTTGVRWIMWAIVSVCEPGSMLPSILSAPIVALSQDFR